MSMQVCSGVDGVEFGDDTVTIEGRESYRKQPVARYLCSACGQCALVNAQTLDDPDRHNNLEDELERAGFCQAATHVAPFNEGIPSLSTTAVSVVQ